MTFIPEDGTGISTANSFVSVADADSFFGSLGNTAWSALSLSEKQAALLEATSFIQSKYTGTWIGSIFKTDQGLDWPRTGAYDKEGRELSGVPKKLVEAVCRLALDASQSSLMEAQERGGRVVMEKVGPITTEYANDAPSGTTYPYINVLLNGLTSYSSGSVPLVRS